MLPTNQKGFAQIAVILILILGVFLGAFLVTHKQTFFSNASSDSTRIEFIDANNQIISQTATPQVKIRLYYQPAATSPSPTANATPASTPKPTTPKAGGKACTYAEGGACHQGNCLDGSQNCNTNQNCGFVPGYSSGKTVACPKTSFLENIIPTAYAVSAGGKQCVYSEGSTCHLGNCLDGTQNCSTNQNCGYVPGYSSGTTVSCSTSAPTLAPTSSGPKPGGKACIYTENGSCHQGNCLDGSQNCTDNQNCGYVSGYSSGITVSCSGATPAPTPTTPKAGGKACIYTEGNACHQGNCIDGSQNCDTNQNCGYVSGYSSGTMVACPTGSSSGNLGLILPTTTLYGFQIDEQTSTKIPNLSQFQTLRPSWVRFVFRPDWGVIPLPYTVNQLVVFNNESATPAPVGSTDANTWKNYTDNTYIPKLKDFITKYPNINAVEIWNEEDICPATSYCPGVPAASYAYMLKNAAAALKAINPQVKVIMGGLAAGQTSFVTNVKAADSSVFSKVDGIGLHPYGKSPDGWRTDLTPFGDLASSINDYSKASGLPIWITEFGLGTDDQAAQSQYLQHASAVFNRLALPMANWYAWTDSMTGDDGLTHWGLLSTNGAMKPSGQTFASISSPVSTSSQIYFRIANTTDGLNSAQSQLLDLNGKIINWTLPSGDGLKTVFAQFQVNGTWQPAVSSSIVLKSNTSTSIYDLNGDGKVNTADVSIFITLMNSGQNPKVADFNNDGVVNAVDLGLLMSHLSP